MSALIIFAVIYCIAVVAVLIWFIWWAVTGRARRYYQRWEYKNKYMEYKAKFDAEHGIDPMDKDELDDFIKLHNLDNDWGNGE